MTTASYTTRIRHDSDAAFREWAQELHDALIAVGCVQTADTGQINFTTVTRAGTNADAAYSIYYMNDSLHATRPCYFKLYWGTGSATDRPRLRLEVGTGSNGSGTIINPCAIRIISSSVSSSFNTDTPYPTYVCMARGQLSLYFKVNRPAAGLAHGGFIISRTCDNTGVPDAGGWFVVFHCAAAGTLSASAWQSFSGDTAVWGAVVTVGGYAYFPYDEPNGSGTSTGDSQACIVFVHVDRIRPLATLCAYANSDLLASNTVALTTIGSTPFTFMAAQSWLGAQVAYYNALTSGTHGILSVYE